jgi:hypothetical protein
VRSGDGHIGCLRPAVPKQPQIWRQLLPVAVLASIMAGIAAMVLMPVTVLMFVVPVVVVTLDLAVPVVADAVSVVLAASGQAQKHGQDQRCRHDYGYLQMSHIKLHIQPQALLHEPVGKLREDDHHLEHC